MPTLLDGLDEIATVTISVRRDGDTDIVATFDSKQIELTSPLGIALLRYADDALSQQRFGHGWNFDFGEDEGSARIGDAR